MTKTVKVVGNTGIDNLLIYKDKCEHEDKVLITLHRRENHELMDRWFETINNIAKNYSELEFIFPMHPNPNVQKHKHLLKSENIKIIKPLNHTELLEILSDSGGIQEECSFFKKKIIVCRTTTERPEAVGLTSFLCPYPFDLYETFNIHIVDYVVSDHDCPFGNGHASEKIVAILKEYL
jgi:UDP-N-acetylglucosamine 2-epimerase (non-hydrolysing)